MSKRKNNSSKFSLAGETGSAAATEPDVTRVKVTVAGRHVIPDGQFTVMRYNSSEDSKCASTAVCNATQNPLITNGGALGYFHGRRQVAFAEMEDNEGENNEEGLIELNTDGSGNVDIACLFTFLVQSGYAAGSQGSEFSPDTIKFNGRMIEGNSVIYVMYEGTLESRESFQQATSGDNPNEWGFISIQLIGGIEDEETHFLALWKRRDAWLITGGEDGGPVLRIEDTKMLVDLLFTEDGRDTLCAQYGSLFAPRTCTFALRTGKDEDGGDVVVATSVCFMPKIQLKSPENWDSFTADRIKYMVPWPVMTGSAMDGKKLHGVQIIKDGDDHILDIKV